MSLDVVGICNVALGYADSEALIHQLDPEESEEARYCALFYPTARDQTLRTYPWNAATRYATVADLTEEGVLTGGWTYKYSYPPDAMTVRYIVDPGDKNNRKIPFQTGNDPAHGQIILTNQPGAEICYTGALTDTALFDPLLADAIARYLASQITGPLTGDEALKQSNYQAWRLLGQHATAVDANEEQEDPEPEASWIEARQMRGGSRRNGRDIPDNVPS